MNSKRETMLDYTPQMYSSDVLDLSSNLTLHLIRTIIALYSAIHNTDFRWRLSDIAMVNNEDSIHRVTLKIIDPNTDKTVAYLYIPLPLFDQKFLYGSYLKMPRIPIYVFGDAPIFVIKTTKSKGHEDRYVLKIDNIFTGAYVTPSTLTTNITRLSRKIDLFDLLPLRLSTVEELDELVEAIPDDYKNVYNAVYTKFKTNVEDFKKFDFTSVGFDNWQDYPLGLLYLMFRLNNFTVDHVESVYEMLRLKDPTLAGYYHKDNIDGYSIIDLAYIIFERIPASELKAYGSNKPLFKDVRFTALKLLPRLLRKLLRNLASTKKTKIVPNIILSTFSATTFWAVSMAVNPISELMIATKATIVAPDNYKEEAATDETRTLHPTMYGLFDPIDTASGKRVGLIHYFNPFVKLYPNGLIGIDDERIINSLPTVKLDTSMFGGLNAVEPQE